MRISSNYYNYYNQLSSTGTSATQTTAADDTTSQDSSDSSVSSAKRKRHHFQETGNIEQLQFTGMRRMDTVGMQDSDEDNTAITDNMKKFKTDMDNLKTANIDSMSADDVKTTLTNLLTDMQSMPRPGEEQGTDNTSDSSSSTTSVDLSNMSEADMRKMLKEMQERINNAPDESQRVKREEAFSKIKSDVDAIKTADIDSMSADDVKSTLTNLITDMNSVRKPQGGYNNNNTTVDLSNMSESDMREMLKKIQENANRIPSQEDTDNTTLTEGEE